MVGQMTFLNGTLTADLSELTGAGENVPAPFFARNSKPGKSGDFPCIGGEKLV